MPNLGILCLLPTLFRVQASPFDEPVEGYGTVTGGEASKKVVEVTTTEMSGPGSLFEALSAGDRIVRFKVGGTFKIVEKQLVVSHPNITIDGRDAPAPGVTISGGRLLVATQNIILRNLRFRESKGDAIAIQGENIHVEHCSIAKTGDGGIDMRGGTEYYKGEVKNCTYAWCIIGPTKKASLMAKIERASIHHNIFFENAQRNPQFNEGGCGDVRNNIVYHWFHEGTDIAEGSVVNVIKNLYLSQGAPKKGALQALGQVYAEGNEGNDPKANQGSAPTPYPEPKVTTQSPLEAANRVLDKAGCFPRDAHDERIITQIRANLPSK